MYHQILVDVLDMLGRLAASTQVQVDAASVMHLLFVALVARISATRIVSQEGLKKGTPVGAIILPVYFFRRFDLEYDFSLLADIFVKSLLLFHLTISVTAVISCGLSRCLCIIIGIGHAISRFLSRLANSLRSRAEMRRRTAKRPLAPPPVRKPVPTHEEKLRSFANEARAAYEAELRMLKTLPLDKDEFAILESQAKRQLLKKLRERP